MFTSVSKVKVNNSRFIITAKNIGYKNPMFLTSFRNGCYNFSDDIRDAKEYTLETACKHETAITEKFGMK